MRHLRFPVLVIGYFAVVGLTDPATAIPVVFVGAVVVDVLADRVGPVVDAVRTRMGMGDDVDEVEAAHRAYVSGEIDEEELERRLALAVDPRASVVVEAVVGAEGVGPVLAARVAERYGSAEDVAAADVDELAEVHNVGEVKATAIKEHLR